jgi:hypothetical protein
MIWHLVLLKPRPDLGAAEGQALVQAFDAAVRGIPSVRDVRVGRRVMHGAGYERAAPDTADYVASIAFDNMEGLHDYLRHPLHENLAARFYQCLSVGHAYDFEMEDVAGLTRWMTGS